MTEGAFLPNWPRGMRESLAAAYVGLSESSFRNEVKAGRAPNPVRITAGRQVWLRDDLDSYLDRLAGRTEDRVDQHTDPVAEWDAFFRDKC